ncbi:MAG: hypothetical protein LQ340_001903 [Diploschistes diacapsis]|nr:MAG: hypothetical protein LQ340_001903 [Diploschistes diacapsis]
MTAQIEEHGWTAVPRDFKVLLQGKPYLKEPTGILVDDIPWPVDELVTKAQEYAHGELGAQTYNHSMRVYYFARAIQETQFPQHALSPRTLALACLLHDIGTTHGNLRATRMSFEFYGGMLALRLLRGEGYGAGQSEAESVAETVMRHQDIGETGKVSFLTGLVQLATIYGILLPCSEIWRSSGIDGASQTTWAAMPNLYTRQHSRM